MIALSIPFISKGAAVAEGFGTLHDAKAVFIGVLAAIVVVNVSAYLLRHGGKIVSAIKAGLDDVAKK